MTATVNVLLNTTTVAPALANVKANTASTTVAMQRHFDQISFKRLGFEIAAIGTAIAGLSYKAIKIAGDVVETRNKFFMVFRDLASKNEQWAAQYSSSVGRWKNDIMDYMAVLQNTFVPMGYTRQQAAEMSKSLAKLAIDVASLMNKSDPEVLANFQSAMVGNVRAVRQYGIMLDQTSIQQELYNMGIMKSVANATVLERATARYRLMVLATKDAENDATRTRFTFINQLKEYRSRMSDLYQAIGEKLIPIVNQYLVAFNKWMAANRDWLATEIASKLKTIVDALAGLVYWIHKYYTYIKVIAKDVAYLLVFERTIVLVKNLGFVFSALVGHLDKVAAAFLRLPAGLAAKLGIGGVAGTAMITGAAAGTAFISYKTLEYWKRSGEYLKDLQQYEKDFDRVIAQANISLNAQAKKLDELYDFTTHKFKTKPGPYIPPQDAFNKKQWAMDISGAKSQEEFAGQVSGDVWGRKSSAASYSQTVDAFEREIGRLKKIADQSAASLKESNERNFQENKIAYEEALKNLAESEVEFDNWQRQRGPEVIDAYRRVYQELGNTGDKYMKLRRAQIDDETVRMRKLMGDSQILRDWQQQKIRELWASETEMGKKFSEVVKNTESSMADAFQGIMDGSKDIGDFFDGIMGSIVQSTQRAVAEMLAAWIRYQLMMKVLGAIPGIGGFFKSMAGTNPFPAKTGHNGGRVGSLTRTKNVDPAIFNDAFRYHGGGAVSKLGPREVPIIATEDEVVSKGNQTGDVFNVTIRALDTVSGVQWLMQNKHSVAAAFTAAKNRNDPARRG